MKVHKQRADQEQSERCDQAKHTLAARSTDGAQHSPGRGAITCTTESNAHVIPNPFRVTRQCLAPVIPTRQSRLFSDLVGSAVRSVE